jgi:hypothetical protein
LWGNSSLCSAEQRVLLKKSWRRAGRGTESGENLENWGTEPTDKEGFHTEGQSFDKIYPHASELFFDGMYHAIVNGGEAPVTAQEGVQVMEVITRLFKVVLRKIDL